MINDRSMPTWYLRNQKCLLISKYLSQNGRALGLLLLLFLLGSGACWSQVMEKEYKNNLLEFGLATGNIFDSPEHKPFGMHFSYHRLTSKKWSFNARMDYYTTYGLYKSRFNTIISPIPPQPYINDETYGNADFSYANHTLSSNYSIDGNLYLSLGVRRTFRYDKKLSFALQVNAGVAREAYIQELTSINFELIDNNGINPYRRIVAFYRNRIASHLLIAVPVSYKLSESTRIQFQLNNIYSSWRNQFTNFSLGLSTSF